MNKFIPLSIPNFEGNEKKYVVDALEQGWVSTGGAYISEMEHKLADYVKVNRVVACQSGTSGLHLALMECGIGLGDLVIVPTLTFIAAVNPVKYVFAEPVFMDCDDSFCMDPRKLRSFCEEECNWDGFCLVHKRTEKKVKAIIVVHVFGNMADMECIMEIALKYHLKVIEDATEALGTYYTSGKYEGMYAGTIGDFGVYSFNGNKIITTGGGGAVTGRNQEALEHIYYISTQAKDDVLFYIHDEVGYNYRMTNLQAALGVAQVEELPEFVLRKQKNYELYKELFSDFDLGKMVEFSPNTCSNKWFYSLKIDYVKNPEILRTIILKLQERGIQTRPIWGLIHKQKPYVDAISYKIEKALYYSNCIINVPSSTQITREEIEYVVGQMKQVLCEEYADE